MTQCQDEENKADSNAEESKPSPDCLHITQIRSTLKGPNGEALQHFLRLLSIPQSPPQERQNVSVSLNERLPHGGVHRLGRLAIFIALSVVWCGHDLAICSSDSGAHQISDFPLRPGHISAKRQSG